MVDQSSHLGGQIWRHRERDALPAVARRWMLRFESSGARYVPRAYVIDAQPYALEAETPNGSVVFRAHAIVLATGARELLLPFPGWTLPNVFGVGGLQALIKAGLNVAGRRVVIAGSGPLVLPVAATAAQHGARVLEVCEQASARHLLAFGAALWQSPSKVAAAVRYRAAFRGAAFRTHTWIERAHGESRVERVTLSNGRRSWTVDCDLVATACGLVPNVELGTMLDCRVVNGALSVDDSQRTSVPTVFAAGECTGVGGEELAIAEGEIAGLVAAGRSADSLRAARDRGRHFAQRMATAFAARPELLERPDSNTIVCRCEDVRMAALRGEWSGGREAKLATRAGMGACQGRVCGAALELMFDWAPCTVRPPLLPARADALASLGEPQP